MSSDIEMQIDYIMYREKEDIKIKNYKVTPREECLTQHRLLCADLLVKEKRKKVWKRQERKIKVWKLKECHIRRLYENKLPEKMEREGRGWDSMRVALLEVAREVCGETRGLTHIKREAW